MKAFPWVNTTFNNIQLASLEEIQRAACMEHCEVHQRHYMLRPYHCGSKKLSLIVKVSLTDEYNQANGIANHMHQLNTIAMISCWIDWGDDKRKRENVQQINLKHFCVIYMLYHDPLFLNMSRWVESVRDLGRDSLPKMKKNDPIILIVWDDVLRLSAN